MYQPGGATDSRAVNAAMNSRVQRNHSQSSAACHSRGHDSSGGDNRRKETGGRKHEEGQRHDATACSGSISNEADVVAVHDDAMTVITQQHNMSVTEGLH